MEKAANKIWVYTSSQDGATRRLLVGGDDDGAVVRLRGVSPIGVRPGSTDVATVWELFRDGEYTTRAPFRPRTVVDLGANVGGFLAFISSVSGPALESYIGVEADASSFAMLEAQVGRMQLSDVAQVVHAAAWTERGTVRFADEGPEWGRAVDPDGGAEVKALPVEDILDLAGLETCELLKMDIEGGESDVLPTIERWGHRVEVLTVELHGQPDAWLHDTVRSAGFVSIPRGEFFRRHPAAIREDVVAKWLQRGASAA